MAGIVVAMCAPTRSGKTYLTTKLAERYGVPCVLEMESGSFPERINDDIATGSRPLERDLYFRNLHLSMHLRARELAQEHPIVFTDALWASTEMYIDMYQIDPFERTILKELSTLDLKTLPWPDVVIILRGDDATSERLWRASSQVFEQGEHYFTDQVLGVKRAFELWVARIRFPVPVIVLDRTELDFDTTNDLKIVQDLLQPYLRN